MHSQESKEKIRKALIGHQVSQETREKIGAANRHCIPWNKGKKLYHLRGPASGNWKGGAARKNKNIRMSAEYADWREAVIKKDDFTCQICHRRGIKLTADHIKPFAIYIELRFDVDNGRALCWECHKNTDTYGYKSKSMISTP